MGADHPEHRLSLIGIRFSIRKEWVVMRLSGCGWVILAIGASIGLAGCGPASGNVSGKVFYKDAPLKGGNVTFAGTDGKNPQTSPISEDGSYSIDKMPVGPVKITVETKSLAKESQQRKNTPPPGVTPPPGYLPPDPADAAKHYVKIPDKYSDPAKSELPY